MVSILVFIAKKESKHISQNDKMCQYMRLCLSAPTFYSYVDKSRLP